MHQNLRKTVDLRYSACTDYVTSRLTRSDVESATLCTRLYQGTKDTFCGIANINHVKGPRSPLRANEPYRSIVIQSRGQLPIEVAQEIGLAFEKLPYMRLSP
jgi:hypothetical protein